MAFKDHFSTQADAYAKHRLTYPAELFEYVASLAPTRGRVWDCATGNGQAAHGLRAHFEEVVATDASARQIEHALHGDGIEYLVASAESSGLPDDHFDAICVATAFHWLDHEAFGREATRVGRDGAVVAVWMYAYADLPQGPRSIIREVIGQELDSYWASEVRRAWDGYAELHFPFEPVIAPPFEIRRTWTAGDYMAYAGTWSAVQAYVADRGHSPFEAHADDLRDAWGDSPQEVVWPLEMRVGRVRK